MADLRPVFDRFRPLSSPNGCRFCGIDQQQHATRWTPGPGLHTFTEPTNAQRKTRMLARRVANQ
jgi:hypothetical protein